jgi:hypothetical protein
MGGGRFAPNKLPESRAEALERTVERLPEPEKMCTTKAFTHEGLWVKCL